MAEQPLSVDVVHYDDYDVTIEYKIHGHFVEFRAKEGVKQDDGSICYTYFPDTATASEFTDDFEKGERFVDGSVKWDGCSHVYFGEGEDNPGYIHLCGGFSFRRLTFVLRQVFRVAGEKMPHWDAEVASDNVFPDDKRSASGERVHG